MAHLDGTGRAPDTQARLLGQGQTQVHELIKGVAKSPTGRALQGALQLPCKDVLNDTVASAVGIIPGFIGLGIDRALAFQLLVRRLSLHPVQLCLQQYTIIIIANPFHRENANGRVEVCSRTAQGK